MASAKLGRVNSEEREPTPDELLEEFDSALRENPRLRRLVRGFAAWLNATLDAAEGPTEDIEQVELVPASRASAPAPADVPGPAPPPPEVERADPPPPTREVRPSWGERPLPELDRVAARARLKAECCRWAITRRRRMEEGADFDEAIKPTDRELLRQVQALELFAWPLDPFKSLPTDDVLQDLAGCYEALASAVELARDLPSHEESGADYREEAYTLLAEVQSALRVGLGEEAEVAHDVDQEEAFVWLRKRVFDTEVYVQRFMRLKDPGNFREWHDMQQRIDTLQERIEGTLQKKRARKKFINKIRYHCQRLARGASDEDAATDWRTIDQATEDLLDCGIPPSNLDLRELLLPLLDTLPPEHELGPGLARVLVEIDRFLAGRELNRSTPDGREREVSAEVREVAALLARRTVVLIGGMQRRDSAAALKDAFGLQELRWITTGSHVSYSAFEPDIARPETALVLLAVRWSSHSYARVAGTCNQYDKPLVRLPGGYSPNQVANQILGQVSDRLRG